MRRELPVLPSVVMGPERVAFHSEAVASPRRSREPDRGRSHEPAANQTDRAAETLAPPRGHGDFSGHLGVPGVDAVALPPHWNWLSPHSRLRRLLSLRGDRNRARLPSPQAPAPARKQEQMARVATRRSHDSHHPGVRADGVAGGVLPGFALEHRFDVLPNPRRRFAPRFRMPLPQEPQHPHLKLHPRPRRLLPQPPQ